MQHESREAIPHRVILLAGMVLFLAVGSRQGFGLFMQPAMQSGIVDREQFSLVVATQYLTWGLTAPLAGALADRRDSRALLVVGSALYFLGFIGSAAAASAWLLWLSAGVLIGCGLGATSFGVLHALVTRATSVENRGTALGRVGAITALGQLGLLFFTEAAISLGGWRIALLSYSVLVLGIAIAALLLPRGATRPPPRAGSRHVSEVWDVLQRRDFWLLSVAFAFSGFQVMATMTHFPAMVADWQLPAHTAIRGLTALSAAAFAGAWAVGHWADRCGARNLLCGAYLARALLSIALVLGSGNAAAVVLLCTALGLLWMIPIGLTSQLTGELFGTANLGSLFSIMFFMHQLGGFAGTWLAGSMREATGAYDGLWWMFAVLTSLGAVGCLRLTRLRAGAYSRHE